MVVVEHDLPGREQLEQIARSIATEDGELPEGDDLQTVLDAAAGLTRYEAEGAFSLSLVRHSAIRPEAIWELKQGMLKKSGLLQLHRGGERFADLGGLENLKGFCLRAMRRQGHRDPRKRPRGALLLGVPGTGKSAYSKALGAETGRPTLIMDVGALMGSLVGSDGGEHPPGPADRRRHGAVHPDDRRSGKGPLRRGLQRQHGQRCQCPAVRHVSHLAQRPRERRVHDLHLQRHLQVAARVLKGRDGSTAYSSWTFPASSRSGRSGSCTSTCSSLDPQQPKPVDARWTGAEVRACCRLAALLDVPLVEAAQKRGARGHDGRRIGPAAAELGQRPVP